MTGIVHEQDMLGSLHAGDIEAPIFIKEEAQFSPGKIEFVEMLLNKNNGRVVFIEIVNHNHFVLPISLFIDLKLFRTILGSAAFAVANR